MSNYKDTIKFWNNIFDEAGEFDPNQPFPYDEIEEGLEWLAETSSSTIDFGCGNGKVLLRLLHLTKGTGTGIDISSNAVNVANELAEESGEGNVEFIHGGISKLSRFSKDRFDSGILFNIVDNVKPSDARKLLREFSRIIETDGKVLLKLNDYIEPSQMEEWGAEELSEDFYRESSGLYLWNLTDEKVEDLLSTFFEIEKEVDIVFEEHEQVNRIYYLKVK